MDKKILRIIIAVLIIMFLFGGALTIYISTSDSTAAILVREMINNHKRTYIVDFEKYKDDFQIVADYVGDNKDIFDGEKYKVFFVYGSELRRINIVW
jgi:flagellar basal body-associated protein FliL